MIRVISERCPQNHKCPLVKKCPEQAIGQEGYNAPAIDRGKCVECLVCVKNCPNEAFAKADDQAGVTTRAELE